MTSVYRIAPASARDFARAGGLNVYETFDEARVACEALMRAHPLDGDTWAVYEAPDPAKRGRGRPRLPPDERGEKLTIRVPTELRARSQAAADREGVELSEWVRDLMDVATEGR